jgi:hypothetical protein
MLSVPLRINWLYSFNFIIGTSIAKAQSVLRHICSVVLIPSKRHEIYGLTVGD